MLKIARLGAMQVLQDMTKQVLTLQAQKAELEGLLEQSRRETDECTEKGFNTAQKLTEQVITTFHVNL
jgi:hypothetical protein